MYKRTQPAISIWYPLRLKPALSCDLSRAPTLKSKVYLTIALEWKWSPLVIRHHRPVFCSHLRLANHALFFLPSTHMGIAVTLTRT